MDRHQSSLIERIQALKEKRNAVILAHNYQAGEVQDVADYLGDSLELSQKAASSGAEVVVFCGVRFMAETASILCPNKKVLTPDLNAKCPMANMITSESLRNLKQKWKNAPVVCYVNTTAEVKAESDVCCTSANAVKVVANEAAPQVIFVPDKYLAHYVSTKTEKKIIPWQGFCPTHVRILPEHIQNQKILHPRAEVMVHPECTPPVIALADEVLSTGGMCKHAASSQSDEFIVGTEVGMLYRLSKENPSKRFFAASPLAVCPNMKSITLEKVLWSLEDLKHEVTVPSEIRVKARCAVEKMLRIR
ncbi:MAG: quinolinate synthase NadA [Candidatus Bathyarchaeota archaeon]|nr:quinolinate synthase NadA [Candidatus Bathyarchaeota archaeon]